MWLWLSLTALLCWSGSDLFSKIGCRDGSDRYSHLKMVIAVGVVMGLHAAFEIFVGGTAISWSVIWTYLPVSLLYISSMALGYLGLRYIELSVSSPICNSSGALVAVLTLLFVGGEDYSPLALLAIVGTWESINLNPTVIIYRNDKDYLLSIIYVSETTKQASPTTYEIQKEGSLYFIAPAPKQIYIDYDPVKDVLNLSSLGDYLRN